MSREASIPLGGKIIWTGIGCACFGLSSQSLPSGKSSLLFFEQTGNSIFLTLRLHLNSDTVTLLQSHLLR